MVSGMNAPAPLAVVLDSTNRITTVPQVFDLVGPDVTARWEKLGDMDSKIHWSYGREAEALIAERVPKMLAFKAIAIKAGKGSQTVRKAYYTFIAFTDEQRKDFDLCPYSIFLIARGQSNPEEVLQYYIDHRASVDEVEIEYPEVGDNEIEKEFIARGYPRYFYGIYREIYGISPFLKAIVQEHLDDIADIIKQVNK